jgi:hypothetical protein
MGKATKATGRSIVPNEANLAGPESAARELLRSVDASRDGRWRAKAARLAFRPRCREIISAFLCSG